MYGYPKIIATRHDVDVLMGYLGSGWATDENKAKGVGYLQSLIDNSKCYVFDKVLADGEQPTGPAPEYIVLAQEDGTRRQEHLIDDPAALIHRMGYTVAEVAALINTIQGV